MFWWLGYVRVWGKLTAEMARLDLPRPPEKALRDLRRLGPTLLKSLFEVVADPLAGKDPPLAGHDRRPGTATDDPARD
jgi:hypothetical protein